MQQREPQGAASATPNELEKMGRIGLVEAFAGAVGAPAAVAATNATAQNQLPATVDRNVMIPCLPNVQKWRSVAPTLSRPLTAARD